jgi:phosphinothricin acetyltransferase
MRTIFREIEPPDLKPMLKVFNHYIEHSNALWFTRKIGMREFKPLFPLKNPKYKTYKVLSGPVMCGFCCFKRYNKRQGYDRTAEVSIYFKPGFTGKGLGSRSLAFLQRQAKKAGIKVLIASISSDNTPSLRLFRKAGYSKCGHLKRIGEKSGAILDVILYQKFIAA